MLFTRVFKPVVRWLILFGILGVAEWGEPCIDSGAWEVCCTLNGGAGWVFVGRAGAPPVQSLEDLAKRVLVLPTRHALEAMIRRDYPSIELRSVKTHAEAHARVERGEAYATIENEIGARLFPSGHA